VFAGFTATTTRLTGTERRLADGRNFGMNDMAGGDLNGDGQPEFAVGYNGGGGVHLVDSTGRPIWRQDDGNVWHVEIVDTDGDGRPEIVHSNAGGQLTVRDATGKVLRRAQTEGCFSQFSLVPWPTGRAGLLHAGDEMIRVIDFDGQVRSRFQTPDTSFLADAHGALARLGGGDHLVVTEFQSNWEWRRRIRTDSWSDAMAAFTATFQGPDSRTAVSAAILGRSRVLSFGP
jgi:VCBS repeat protein